MTVATAITDHDFVAILSLYDLGVYIHSEPIQQGTVQSNYFIQTTQGKFVFRYYETRSKESVFFERDLLVYLSNNQYPCPSQIKNIHGTYIGVYRHKPYTIFGFVDGQHIENPNIYQRRQLIQKAAELQKLTQDFRSLYTSYRWNYDPDLCRVLASKEALRINTPSSHAKFTWLARELTKLDLPHSLPKGVCHCDFHFSNVLFKENELVALLDFDDANYTYLQFDLVGLIEYWAWPHTVTELDLLKARRVIQEYSMHRPLPQIEQQHLYDVYKLSIFFDCVWYFGRGSSDAFYEKRKIDALNNLGRQNFFDALFRI